MSLLEILSLAPLAFWIALALDRRRSWPGEVTLPQAPRREAPRERTEIVALVPARDETRVLAETLPSLLTQEIKGLRVLLIDDGSTDDTATTARRLAEECGQGERLTILEAPPAPPGWSGKVHALSRGLAALGESGSPPRWLLLVDADITLRPRAVEALLSQATDRALDLVSVMARLNAESFWERLLIPPFVFFFQLLYPFRLVKRPESRVAAAAGGCVLLRTRTLLKAGGFEALRGAVIDDVALAKTIAAAGGRLWLGLDAGIRSRRRYERLGEIWRMVSRTAFVQLRSSGVLLALTLAGLALFVASPPFLAAVAALEAAREGTVSASVARAGLWSVLAWALETAALAPAARHHRVPSVFAATLPFSGLLYGLMTWSSAWNHWRGRGATWKGRSYGRD